MHLDDAFVRYWSGRYESDELGSLERELLTTTHLAVARRGYLTADDLTKIAKWKTQRVLGVLERAEETVRDVTRVALAPDTPGWMRHRILCILDGVGHPMASAILTVWNPETQTMFDVRVVAALRELQARQALDLELPADLDRGYWAYIQIYRKIAEDLGVSHRGLDRALWKWHEAGMPATWPGCE